MAKKKISGLPASGALTGTEIVPIVQSGTTKRTTTQAIADLGGGGGISGSGTANYVSKWSDSTTLTDSLFFSDADVAKTIYSGADKGLYIDFTAYDNTTAYNVPILDGTYQNFPNALSQFVSDDNVSFSNHNFWSNDGLSSLKFGQYIDFASDGGGLLRIELDKGNWGHPYNSVINWNPEEGFSFDNYSTIYLRSIIGENISKIELYASETNFYNQGDGYFFTLKLDTINQVIKTQSNSVDKGLYIDYPNGIYGLGFTETGDFVGENVTGVKLTSNNITIGDTWGYSSYIDINFSEIRTYLETDRVKYRNLTTTQINALTATAQEGDVVYNVTLHALCFYNGSSWQKVNHSNM